jgi:hypothetical protein
MSAAPSRSSKPPLRSRATTSNHCITERETPFGYWWHYTHSQGEPDDTLKAATIIAVNVARDKARKDGKTYLVASTPPPTATVYIFASDHPDAADPAINVMLELTPSGKSIRRPGFHTSPRH